MQRVVSIVMLAAVLGVGWMFVKGLHLEDLANLDSVLESRKGSSADGALPPAIGGGAFQPTPLNPGPTVRIATFNIQIFGNSKASHTQVMQVLGAAVRQFDIVAIQEIRTQDDYFIPNFLKRYVNVADPARSNAVRQYNYHVGPRLGRTNSTEQYAYVWDTQTIDINRDVVFTISDPSDLLHREPEVAMFRARGAPPEAAFTFILINTHTDPDEVPQELDALAQVYEVVRRMQIAGRYEDDIILMGDLNTDVPSSPMYAQPRTGRSLTPEDLFALGQVPGIYPVIRNESTNARGSRLHDNILIHRQSNTEFTGNSGVFDLKRQFGLTQEQTEMVSDHLPVWAEFSVYESYTPGRMASQPAGMSR